VELNADGTDYLVRTDAAGTPVAQPWPELLHVLRGATAKYTLKDILQRWPAEEGCPDDSTVWRWLRRAARQGLVCCSGCGYRGDPFRYWLAEREPLLWPGQNASREEQEAWRERCHEHYRKLREQPASGG
jgi:hypothetical protein